MTLGFNNLQIVLEAMIFRKMRINREDNQGLTLGFSNTWRLDKWGETGNETEKEGQVGWENQEECGDLKAKRKGYSQEESEGMSDVSGRLCNMMTEN